MLELHGRSVSEGIAIGKLSFYSNENEHIPKYLVENTKKELQRYDQAMEQVKIHFDRLYHEALKRLGKNESVIFRTHIMILEDSKFVEMVKTSITKKHFNAEHAVHNTAVTIAQIFKDLDDEYLSARYTDIIDASNALLEILNPNKKENVTANCEPVIVAAKELLPSETIRFKKENLLGFLTNKGTVNSHSAILARMLNLPFITQISVPLAQYEGSTIIIDGLCGRVLINPDKNTLTQYRAKKERYYREQTNLRKQIGLPSVTLNGQKVVISANISSLDSIEKARASDTEGIGFFNSDYLFLNRQTPPNEEEQFAAYQTVLRSFDAPVTICTAILGANLGIGYLDIPDETNPANGYNGIRISLMNTDFFKTQLRALYRASVFGKLRILLPMITSVNELEYVMRTIEQVKSELSAEGHQFSDRIQIGAAIQTPAAALISDEICKIVDFVTILTNTLTVHTLALDRENQKLEYFYEVFHRAVLRLIKTTCENAHRSNKWVAVTGELTSDQKMVQLLLALHTDELVMVPARILKTKAAVRSIDTSKPIELLSKL